MRHFIVFFTAVIVLTLCGCSNGSNVVSPDVNSPEDVFAYLNPEKQADTWWWGEPLSIPGADPTEGSADLEVHFYDDGSHNPDGVEITRWYWKFQRDKQWGKGWVDFTSTQGDAWCTYEEPGEYEALLLIIYEKGHFGLGSIQITVNEPQPDYGWARTWGGVEEDVGHAVTSDNSGNTYITGVFRDIVDFDPGQGVDERTSNGDRDIFLSKFDSGGNRLWTLVWGGSESVHGDLGLGVIVDDFDNVYVTGSFRGTVDFDPGLGVNEHTSNGTDDIYLSKFDPDGNFIWVLVWGGSNYDYGMETVTDGFGNIFVTGSFRSTVDFDPGPGVDQHTANGSCDDMFLSKFDLDGNFQWARTWGGPNAGDFAYDINIAETGNVYTTGCFQGTVDFDPGPGIDNHSSNGYYDIYINKFDTDGNFQWARTWGGTEGEYGNGIVIDELENAYITGWFDSDEVDFDPGPGLDERYSNGVSDAFLSKFDPSGNFIWANTWGGSFKTRCRDVVIDNSNSVYITGWFETLTDFDPGPGIDEHMDNGHGDIFISKFESSGDYIWTHTWGGNWGDEGYDITVDDLDNIYLTGYFYSDSVDFDPGSEEDIHETHGLHDVFLMKVLPNGYWK